MVNALDEQLTTKQVADVLRVSESSVKRWCDSGVIPTVRTVGGHRRIARSALMQFLKTAAGRDDRGLISGDQLTRMGVELESLQEEKESTPPPRLTGSLDQQRLREAFEEALLRGDEAGSRRALTQWYQAERAFAPLADELIAKTFHRLGDLWECNQIEIYQERRSAELCVRLVHELRRMVVDPPPEAPLAMGATPEFDPYSLPNQLIELVLRESGWRTHALGSNLPFETLASAVATHRPRLFWLSVSHIENIPTFLRRYQDFAESLPKEVTMVVGGRALTDEVRPKMKYAAHCDNLRQLADFAAALRGQRQTWGDRDN